MLVIRVPGFVKRIIKALSLSSVTSPIWAWFGGSFDYHTGDWQRNIKPDSKETLLSNSAIYACVTGIAADVGKLRIKLTQDDDGIWTEIKTGSPWLPVLRKPNEYQNRIKFLEQWILSKLLHGNAYILKQREEARGIVNGLYVLDPLRVVPLISQDGGVYYRLNQDWLSKIEEQIVVPASEMIHDRMCCLWHPLIGVPPLYACASSGTLGKRIQNDSTTFFNNRSLPGGMLTAPGNIDDETAARLKKQFEEKYGGENLGRLFVAGDGLKFEPMRMTSEQSQLAEQLKLTIQDIGVAFHYPLFKLGEPLPAYAGNAEVLLLSYYTDCLQGLIEQIELSLDEGLELPRGMGTELDLDNLLRMDTASLYKGNSDAVGGGWMSPDEARFRANLPSVAGGKSPYLQQQNYSLAALAKRDAQADPFKSNTPPSPSPSPAPDDPKPPPAVEPPAKSIDKDDFRRICIIGLKEFMGKRRKDRAA